jgi:DNA-binding transcriptional MerR regulator
MGLTWSSLQDVTCNTEVDMTISEVSEKYDIPEDTLRYYERIGLIPPVHRKRGSVRDFQDEDCKWVEFARCMRHAGLSIEVLIEYLRLFQLGDETVPARKELLIEQRKLLQQKISDMQETLEKLNFKIENYERIGDWMKEKSSENGDMKC